MNFKSLEDVINSLKIVDEHCIIRLDDNIVLFMLEDKEKEAKKLEELNKKARKFKVRLTPVITDKPMYLMYDKHGLVIDYEVEMIGMLHDSEDEPNKYVVKLRGVDIESNEVAGFSLNDEELGVLIYVIDEENGNYFICNNLKEQIIKDSCLYDENLKLLEMNNGYILHFNGDRYMFNKTTMANKINDKVLMNIGRFIKNLECK